MHSYNPGSGEVQTTNSIDGGNFFQGNPLGLVDQGQRLREESEMMTVTGCIPYQLPLHLQEAAGIMLCLCLMVPEVPQNMPIYI